MPISGPNDVNDRDAQASGRFLAALGGADEAEIVHFRALIASEAYAILALDLSLTVVSWNRGAEKLFGYASEAMVGSNLAIVMTEVDQAMAQLSRRIALGETVELDAKLRGSNGRLIDTFITATPVRSPAQLVVGAALIIRDVSQAKEVERRLREVSQLEAMARVAAGVAHDINNVLAVVQSYAEFVAHDTLTEAQANDLRLAQEAARRGASLTQQLLSLPRGRESEPITLELNDAVRNVEDLLRRALGAGIELSTRLSTSPLSIMTRPGQVDQILMNLVLNARDAMPLGGRLDISLEAAAIGPGHEAHDRLPRGSYAKLVVQDTGIGMGQDTLSQIFAPFFTTKPIGRGAGLGLLVVHDAVHELKGDIFVRSKVDEGTTFTIYLPLGAPESFVTPVRIPVDACTDTILVVDSDSVLRAAIVRILNAAGYSTLEAASSVEAEDVLRKDVRGVRVVISDLSGPGSKNLTKAVHQAGAEVRLIYLSGQIPRSATPDENISFVAKPFASGELLTAVARALKGPPTLRPTPLPRKPFVLVVDDDQQLSESLVRVLKETDLAAESSKSGLHALQILKQRDVDVIVVDHFMPGMDGIRLLELVFARFPTIARILFTAHASPDVVLNAVNRARVSKVLLKNMHPVAIRDEIAAIAIEAMRRRPV
jgi:PAS domain S-box-containing protein